MTVGEGVGGQVGVEDDLGDGLRGGGWFRDGPQGALLNRRSPIGGGSAAGSSKPMVSWCRARSPSAVARRPSMVSVDPSLARCSAPDFTASASANASGSSRLASIAMVPSKETCWVSKVTCRLSADLSSACSTSSGMYRTRASSTRRPNAAGRQPGRAPEHLLVHVRRGLQGEGEGGLRDQPRPPPRHQARLDRGPQPGQAVGELDAVGEEPPRTVVGATQHGRELRHTELIDRRRPLTRERLRRREARLGELGVREVQVRPMHRQAA